MAETGAPNPSSGDPVSSLASALDVEVQGTPELFAHIADRFSMARRASWYVLGGVWGACLPLSILASSDPAAGLVWGALLGAIPAMLAKSVSRNLIEQGVRRELADMGLSAKEVRGVARAALFAGAPTTPGWVGRALLEARSHAPGPRPSDAGEPSETA